MRARLAISGVALVTGVARAHADEPAALPAPLVATDTFAYTPGGTLALGGGLVAALPTALPTGLATGLGGGATFGRCGRWGVRAAWASATESTMAWEVTHHDVRVRLAGALLHTAGRGTIGVRLGVGGTLIHERRVRAQGERAGLMGEDLETTAVALVPAADLDAVVAIRVIGPWALTVSGGPSVAVIDGGARAGWAANLGVAWHR